MSTLTNVCRVQEETREVTSVEEGHDVERVVETIGEARERASATESVHRQSCGGSQLCVKMATSIVTRGLCVLEARDVKIELFPWIEQQQ